MHRLLGIILLVCTFYALQGQEVVSYPFNDCNFADEGGIYGPASGAITPDCEACGPEGDGLFFNGNLDHLVFPEALDTLLYTDFTLSFYFNLQATSQLTDLFSIRKECNFDSLLAVSYDPVENEIITTLSRNISDYKIINAPLREDACWHRYTLTKNGLLYSVYLDNVLIESFIADGDIIFSQAADMAFAQSPCLLSSEVRFRGWIDDFKIYRRALSSLELTNNYLYPDRIITRDTTITQGSSVSIQVGASCQTDFVWEPEAGLDDANYLDPIATPVVSTTYTLRIINPGNCVTSDSIRINVINEEDLECENLLIPNAFTPNNDGLNDRYGISNLFIVDEVTSFGIYDRWGNLLWEGMDKDATWDGSYDGNTVTPGIYMYKIRYFCRDKEYLAIDNFTVLR